VKKGAPARLIHAGAAALLVGALVPLFYYPVASVFAGAVAASPGTPALARVAALAADPYVRHVIAFTFGQAAASTLLAVALGLPGAWLLARFRFPGRTLVRSLTTIPFVMPSILVVLGFVLFFGNNGVLNRALMAVTGATEPPLRILYSFPAILLAHAFYNFPICVRVVASLWERITPHPAEAARSLGARGPRLFLEVTLPQLRPAVLSSAALIFLFCFLSFAVILVLGGGPRYTTIEVEIYRLARVDVDLAGASALALFGTMISLLLLAAQIRLERRAAFVERLSGAPEQARLRSPAARAAAAAYVALVAVIVLGPLLSIVAQSLAQRAGWGGGGGLTLRWYAQLAAGAATRFGGSYRQAVVTSLGFGVGAAALSLVLGVAVARLLSRRASAGWGLVEALLMAPMGVSGVVLGLAYVKGWGLGAGWPAVVTAHAVIAYPFVARTISGVLARIRPSLLEASRSLGARPLDTLLRIELPLARAGLVTGAAFAFAISMGEMNATLLLAGPGVVTIPIAIYRLVGSYNFFAACAMGTVLMLVSLGTFWVIERVAPEAL
jgi:thiamine transport system permease protein